MIGALIHTCTLYILYSVHTVYVVLYLFRIDNITLREGCFCVFSIFMYCRSQKVLTNSLRSARVIHQDSTYANCANFCVCSNSADLTQGGVCGGVGVGGGGG